MVARQTHNLEVGGSIPSLATLEIKYYGLQSQSCREARLAFSLSIPKLLGSSIFLFVLQDEEVVCLAQYLINICAIAFRWIKEIDLCKTAFEIIKVSEDVITIAKEDENARKAHVKKTYLPGMAHKIIAAPP